MTGERVFDIIVSSIFFSTVMFVGIISIHRIWRTWEREDEGLNARGGGVVFWIEFMAGLAFLIVRADITDSGGWVFAIFGAFAAIIAGFVTNRIAELEVRNRYLSDSFGQGI